MTNTDTQTEAIKKFEVSIREKAEHWSFQVEIKAASESDAWKRAAKEYPKRSYSIREVREAR